MEFCENISWSTPHLILYIAQLVVSTEWQLPTNMGYPHNPGIHTRPQACQHSSTRGRLVYIADTGVWALIEVR